MTFIWLKRTTHTLLMLELHDLSLRDGNHAINHRLTRDDIIEHCIFAEECGIQVVEVGHGNGLGASSLTLGQSTTSDIDAINIAKLHLKGTKLSAHIIPGVATIKRDIEPALISGVDIFRVATHCTEASLSKTHIEYIASKGASVFGALMMSATCSVEVLVEESLKMKSYGANTVIIMDSSGSFLPDDVGERVKALVANGIRVGFHGHDNLHLAVANSLSAIKNGAEIIDGTINGFGAGAGNTPFEIIALLTGARINMNILMQRSENFKYKRPVCTYIHALTAYNKLFSGFDKHIIKACEIYDIPISDFITLIGKRKLIAGQEDILWSTAATFHQNVEV